VANAWSHNVSVLLGNGDGTFQAAVNYGVGADPYSVAIGDLNGDVKPDLAVANAGSADVAILINEVPDLSVRPSDRFISSGPWRGPFDPPSKDYTLKNLGGDSIDWTASKTQDWLDLSSPGGSLSPGESTTVTVSINSNANTLTPGTYNDTVSFTNTTNGSGSTTRKVTLTVYVAAITLIGPNGGEVIPSGSTYTIQWVAPPETMSFKLKYSMNNGKKWIPIDSGIPDTSYDWAVPTPPKNKNKCLVKVIGFNASGKKVGADSSDAPFTIEVLTVTSPSGGEICTSGDPYTITWTTNGTKKPVEKVVLKYTKNGGKRWKKIEALTENMGTYDWTVPDVPKTKSKCLVTVVLKDKKGNTVASDASDGYFTIEPEREL